MNIQDFLKSKGVPFEVELHPDAYDAQHLAQALHVSGKRVAKAVMVRANHGYVDVVAVLPATHRLDMPRLSAALGGAAVSLATEIEIAERCPDCEFGILSPFGSRYGMKTVVDGALAEAAEIHFAGNNHHEAIRMSYHDFEAIEHPLAANFSLPAVGELGRE